MTIRSSVSLEWPFKNIDLIHVCECCPELIGCWRDLNGPSEDLPLITVLLDALHNIVNLGQTSMGTCLRL